MAKFISKYPTYTLILTPSQVIEKNGKRKFIPKVVAQFENSVFETNDAKIIKKMKKSPFFRIDFWEEKTPAPVKEKDNNTDNNEEKTPAPVKKKDNNTDNNTENEK